MSKKYLLLKNNLKILLLLFKLNTKSWSISQVQVEAIQLVRVCVC